MANIALFDHFFAILKNILIDFKVFVAVNYYCVEI